LTAAFLFLHPADGRVFFVIPWMGKTLLGTTDTECDGSPDRLDVTPADVAYLLTGHNHYLAPYLTPADLLGSFAGLRPLIRNHPGDPAAVSREFQLFPSPSGLLSVAGGKYTTYRHMAEVITDAVLGRLGLRRRCRTRDLRLDGAPDTPWGPFESAAVAALRKHPALSAETARHLVCRYGRRAPDVAAYLDGDPALARPVISTEPDLLVEFAYQRAEEMAVLPADFLRRRTRLGLFHPDLLDNPPGLTRSPTRPASGEPIGRGDRSADRMDSAPRLRYPAR
jgi:glycerol-3-phosphate dehydrogenase